MGKAWRDLEIALSPGREQGSQPIFSWENLGCPLAEGGGCKAGRWREGVEGVWRRLSPPQKCRAHAVRKLMGFGARKTQVQILIMPPDQPSDLGLTYWERHGGFPPLAWPLGSGHWAWDTSLSRVLTAWAGFITSCGNVCPSSRFNVCSFVLLKYVG